jgi:hypothetical protein
MGGGSSFLAVQYNPAITAIANLAAAETNPSAIAAAANITIPALVIAGANDCAQGQASHRRTGSLLSVLLTTIESRTIVVV